jgi:hypothetical protein
MSSKILVYLIVLISLTTFVAQSFNSIRADSGGLQTSIAVDIVGNAFSRDKTSPDSKLSIREAELFFYAPVDQTFEGILGIAAHQEKGVALFEIHEATIGSTKLIPWSRFRIGQYFLGVGKLNSVHRHDWPFTTAPKVHQEFFGKEGVDDTGIEYSMLTPLPFYLDITFGVTNGWKYGHVHNSGKKPKTPTHYARVANFVELPFEGGLQTGLNYLSRKDSKGTKTTLFGLDITAKWREGKSIPFFFQGEIWHREFKPEGSLLTRSLGFYGFPQINLIESLNLGIRFDGYSILKLKDASGKKIRNYEQSYVPTLTWKPSEFSTFRASYQWNFERLASHSNLKNSFLEVQTTFILGAHPAHDF